jgi:hypothetical protein
VGVRKNGAMDWIETGEGKRKCGRGGRGGRNGGGEGAGGREGGREKWGWEERQES